MKNFPLGLRFETKASEQAVGFCIHAETHKLRDMRSRHQLYIAKVFLHAVMTTIRNFNSCLPTAPELETLSSMVPFCKYSLSCTTLWRGVSNLDADLLTSLVSA